MPSRAWLPLLGVVMVAVAAVLPFTRHAPSLLLVVLALAAAAAGIAYLLWAAPPGAASVLFALYLALLIAVYGITGDAALGFFAAASFAVLREPRRRHVWLLAGATLVLNAVQLLTGSETPLTLLATDAGIVFFAAIGGLLVSERRQRERADRLVAELDAARRREQEAAVGAERARMARDLHDLLAHTLSGLAIQLEAARMLAGDAPDALRDRIETAQRLARAGLQEARGAVGALRGEPVSVGSLSDLVEEHRLSSGAPVTLIVSGAPRRLDADAAMTVYRIVQESLSNVRRHAPSARSSVTVDWRTDAVIVDVRNPSDETRGGSGWGIAGMRERAAALGGHLDAGWAEGTFAVTLELPYR